MLISRKCRYALRAVFELAFRSSDGPRKISDIAAVQKIPPRFLEVILNQLRHAGVVQSRRGSRGGYVLTRLPESLSVGEVIKILQGPIQVDFERPSWAGAEPLAGNWAFERLWQQLNKVIRDICDGAYFSELVDVERTRRLEYITNYNI